MLDMAALAYGKRVEILPLRRTNGIVQILDFTILVICHLSHLAEIEFELMLGFVQFFDNDSPKFLQFCVGVTSSSLCSSNHSIGKFYKEMYARNVVSVRKKSCTTVILNAGRAKVII